MTEKKVFVAIREIEVEIEASHKRRQQRQYELLQEYLHAREPLLQRRFEIVTGRSEPTDEELKGFKAQGGAAAAAGSVPVADMKAATGGSNGSSVGSGSGGGKGSPARGVPFFWLNALCNEEKLAPLISPRDRCALEYLEDVRYVTGPMGLCLEFHFAPNPYFHNKVLRKGTYIKRVSREGDDPAASPSSGPLGVRGLEEVLRDVESWRDEGTVIDWKPGRSLLVRAESSRSVEAGKATAARSSSSSSVTKKKDKKSAAGGSSAAVTSRSRRHHGKHSGPAPDLPDPEQEEEEREGLAEEEKEEEEEQQQRDSEGSHSVRQRPCPSFFRFFLPLITGELRQREELDPTLEQEEEGEQEDEALQQHGSEEDTEEEAESGSGEAAMRGAHKQQQQQRRAMDGELMEAIIKRVIPRAVHLYLSSGNVVPAGTAAVTGGKVSSRGDVSGNGSGGSSTAAAAGGGGGGGGSGRKGQGPGRAGAAAVSAAAEAEEEEEEGFQLVSGSPAGDVASLALGAQKALHVLLTLQRQMDELAAQLKRGEWEAWLRQMEAVEKLTCRRRTLLVGPAGNPGNKLSIPAFWLRVLRGMPYGSLLVQHRDERALSYLADVRLVWDTSRMPTTEEPYRKMDLELEFLPNPYLTNSVLRKRFTFHAPGGSLNRLWVASTKSDEINWHPGRDLTVKFPAPQRARQQLQQEEEEEEEEEGDRRAPGARAARPRKLPTFFAFFDDTPGALVRAFGLPGGQSARALQEANQAQEAFLGELLNLMVHFAGSVAEQSTVDVDDLGDEEDDDDDDDDEQDEDEEEEDGRVSDEDEGEEEAVAARRAARRAAAKGAARRRGGTTAGGDGGRGGGLLLRLLGCGGGGGSLGWVILLVLGVIAILAQVLVFLDTLEYVRGRFKWAA